MTIMFLQRTKHKLSTKTGIFAFLFVFVFSLAVSTVFPLVWQTPTVSGLTPVQLTDCYKFNGSTYTVDQLDKTKMLLPSAAISAKQAKYKECVSIGACSASAPLTDPFKYTVTCQNPASSQGAQLSVTPVISAICGNGGGGDAAISAYQTCSAEVSRVYNVCQNQSNQMTSTSTNQQKADLMANCMAGKMTGINISAVSAAIFKGQSAADNNTAAVNAQDTCVARGGTYDATASPPTCTGGNQDANPPTCEMNWESALAWMVCPVVTLLADAVTGIQNIINKMLATDLIKGEKGAQIKDAWSNFRVYGNIFLLIALILIVYSEVVGGGVFEAYTVKKALPRLLIAAVLINISYYIVLALNDIVNIIGNGIYTLLTAPFVKDGSAAFSLDIFSFLGLTATAATGGAVVAAFLSVGVLGDVLASAVMPIFLFVILPTLLILLAVLVVIILRQGIILLLVIVSPVAFALYALPNTEKYFKKWWEELTKALIVFPLIMAIFAISKDLGVVLDNGDSMMGLKSLVQLILIVAPIGMIVFAFKLAGGILSNIIGFARGLSGKAHQGLLGNPNDYWSRRNMAKRGFQNRWTQGRERVATAGKTGNGGNPSWLQRKAGAVAGAGNLAAIRARYNKEDAEAIDNVTNNGDDSFVRDMFIDEAANGKWYRMIDMEYDSAGRLMPAAGASPVYGGNAAVAKQAHKKAVSLFKGNKSGVQRGLYYEWKKTGFKEEQLDRIKSQYGNILDEHGFDRNTEGGEMMASVKFNHQGQSHFQKYESYGQLKDGSYGWKTDRIGHAGETAHSIDLYGASKQDEKDFNEMGVTYQQTARVIDTLFVKTGLGDNHVIEAADMNSVMSDHALPGRLDTSDYNQYVGRTVGEVKNAHRQIAATAESVDPSQVSSITGAPPASATPSPAGTGTPPPSIGRGISSAPVDVQAAAKNLAELVKADETNRLLRGLDTVAPTPPRDDSGHIPRG